MMAELDILNGFAGKVISDCIDITVEAIKKADKDRKSANQTMETRIYQVTIDALNEFPYNKYKKEEVYDAAESILKELKRGNRDYKEAVRFGLNLLSSEITGDICGDFLKILYDEICMDENDILYKEILLLQEEKILENIHEGFDVSNRNDEETHRKLNYLIEKEYGKEIQDTNYSVKNPIVNRADEYAQRWDKNVFLNDFDEEDENAGTEIKLSQIYIEECLPHYKWKTNNIASNKLKDLLSKRINEYRDKKMLLILGQPGIGKSTLITWIMANFMEKKDKFLVYQFASDLHNINWQSNDILNEILNALNLDHNKLKNKILILDGFDEISITGDRESILAMLDRDTRHVFFSETFFMFITCRVHYIDPSGLTGCDYITLQPWDEGQIKSFCKIYGDVNNNVIPSDTIQKIIENKEALGIPLILYMILALNIAVEKDGSIVDVYDKIFSLDEGGIYNRCIKNSDYAPPHRISKIKQQIHKISQRIAFWMFENNPERASIPQKNFKKICGKVLEESEETEDIQRDVLIGNYFKLIKHCEGIGTDELQFIHRSIYEYFVIVYFFESINELTSKEEVAGVLGELLKDGHLTIQMFGFIKCKFDSIKKYNLSKVTKDIFNIMLRDGMTYHIKVDEPLNNVIEREKNIFLNMLRVVGLWNSSLGKLNNRIIIYLQCNRQNDLDMRGIELGLKKGDIIQESDIVLKELFIREENLFIANLSRSYLCGANLSRANLNEVDLREANLKEANLSGANLNKVNLSRADLSGADLRGVNLSTTNLFGANLSGTIFE